MFLSAICWGFALTTLGSSFVSASSHSRCEPVTFSVHAVADNIVFQYPPSPDNAADIVDFIDQSMSNSTGVLLSNDTLTVEGDYTVQGVYCRPHKPAPHSILQFLVHGITYNKTLWSGFDFGHEYDWHAKATSRGYHTLAIDRLSHGDDTQFLDPVRVVQGSLQVEILHKVIVNIRKGGTDSPLSHPFDQIAFVGHSWGSTVGVGHVSRYPNDFDAFVGTGFSAFLNRTALATKQRLTPAALASMRFAHLPYGYLTVESAESRESAFYGGLYDPRIPKADYMYQDIVSIGEACYAGFATPATTFTGPALIVTGENDTIFCNDVSMSCNEILDATARLLFPNSNYETYAPANTGHDLTLHYSAQKSMNVVHDFLDRYFERDAE